MVGRSVCRCCRRQHATTVHMSLPRRAVRAVQAWVAPRQRRWAVLVAASGVLESRSMQEGQHAIAAQLQVRMGGMGGHGAPQRGGVLACQRAKRGV